MNESNGHRDHRLSSLYREGAWPEPSRQIDQAILAASRRAWREQHSYLKRWAPAFAIAATVLLTSSLVLKVYLAQPDVASPSPDAPLQQRAGQAPAEANAATAAAAPAANEKPAPQPVTVPRGFSENMDPGEAARLDRMKRDMSTKQNFPPSESPVPAPRSALADKAAVAPKKEAKPSAASTGAAQPSAPVSFFGATAPAPRAAVAKPAQLPAPAAAARTEPAQPQPAEAQPAQTPPPVAQAAAVSGGVAKAAERAPQAWIDDIRKLMTEGKSEEAGAEIAKFKKRYPDYVLPDDLR
ncbi:MAG TPA: hypothetical protein VFK92_17740 [Burkholderiales bacterium]|nr:hypothetical protein [Burkholderiales bacterium]